MLVKRLIIAFIIRFEIPEPKRVDVDILQSMEESVLERQVIGCG